MLDWGQNGSDHGSLVALEDHDIVMRMKTYTIRHQQRKGKHGKAISDLQPPEGIKADGHSCYEA